MRKKNFPAIGCLACVILFSCAAPLYADYNAFLGYLSNADSDILEVQRILFVHSGSGSVALSPSPAAEGNATAAAGANATTVSAPSNTTMPGTPVPGMNITTPVPGGTITAAGEAAAEEGIAVPPAPDPGVILLQNYEVALSQAMAWIEETAHKGLYLHNPLSRMAESTGKNMKMLKAFKRVALTSGSSDELQQAIQHAIDATAQIILRNTKLCRALGVYTGSQ